MSGVRTFVGVPLDEHLREALVRAGEQLSSSDPRWKGEKWVPAENLHITLKFIGSIPAEDVTRLDEALQAVTRDLTCFSVALTGVSPVPSARRARMLWASFLDPSGACGSLAARVEAVSLPFGAEPDERSFSPHATLVRARRPHAVNDEAIFSANECLVGHLGPVSVRRATLFASQLGPHGPIYSELGSYALRSD